MVVVALFAAHPASAAGKPAARCPATFDTAQAEAGEIQAAYVLSEARNRKPEACVRAKLYIRALQRSQRGHLDDVPEPFRTELQK